MLQMTQIERSRAHIALSREWKLQDEPETSEEISRAAFAEAVALHAGTPNLGIILNTAYAVDHFVAMNFRNAKPDMKSLMEATGLDFDEAELALRICGAERREGYLTITQDDSKSPERVIFEKSFLIDWSNM